MTNPPQNSGAVTSSDLTFITNEQGKHLGERFGVLLAEDTRFFDCLVGYFFISGFHRLHPALTKTERIRILIGIKTDGATYELIQTAKEQQEFVLESHAQVRERVPGEILGEFQKSGDTSQIEDGVRTFVEWIKSGKLEVRAYPSERVHAKLYIMTFHEGDRDRGRVITGSSNFTEAGLQDNLEFNVELKNRSDYDFAIQKFNELWAKSVDVTKDYVTTIEVKSPYAQFTPYELYLKFLYEYFRGELNLPDEIEDMYLPTGFKKLKYQEEAVLNARKVLGANVWRVKAGDRLAWVSAEDDRAQVKDVVDMQESALALGENSSLTFESLTFFGAPEDRQLPPLVAAAMRAGFDAAVALGTPRVFAEEWRFGPCLP